MSRRHPEPQQPASPSTPTMWALIAANLAVFAMWQKLPQEYLEVFAGHMVVSLPGVMEGRVWTLLTAEFSHVDTNHLLFNMLGLFVFGRGVEMVLGGRRLLGLYVAGGVAASLAHVFFSLATADPTPAIGASGAVMALAFVYAALFPAQRLLLMFIIPIRARTAVALFVLIDLVGLTGVTSSNIAHAAHLGGLAMGAVFYLAWLRPRLQAHAAIMAAQKR